MWPDMMITPPTKTARRSPRTRSATQPPGTGRRKTGPPENGEAGPAPRRTKPQPPRRNGGCHEEDQERAHAVIAEALPHLGEEKRGESARVTEEPGVALDEMSLGRAYGGGGQD